MQAPFFELCVFELGKERLMYYNVFCFSGGAMSKKSVVITMRLSRRDLGRIEAVRALEKVERSTLLKEFIENGLSQRIVHLYQKGKLTAGRAAEILGVPLREFLEKLEEEGVPVNWDSQSVKEYLKARYGESSVAKSGV